MANHKAAEQRRLSASECDSTKEQQGPLGSVPYGNREIGLESVLEGGCQMGEGRRSGMQGGIVRTEGRTRIETRGDTVKRPQGGREIRNGRVLVKWGKMGEFGFGRYLKINSQGCFA